MCCFQTADAVTPGFSSAQNNSLQRKLRLGQLDGSSPWNKSDPCTTLQKGIVVQMQSLPITCSRGPPGVQFLACPIKNKTKTVGQQVRRKPQKNWVEEEEEPRFRKGYLHSQNPLGRLHQPSKQAKKLQKGNLLEAKQSMLLIFHPIVLKALF